MSEQGSVARPDETILLAEAIETCRGLELHEAPTVMIGGSPAARVTDITQPCMLPGCVPGGPGMIAMGSTTVLIAAMPAGRAGDMTAHAACVGPIPGPVGTVLPPCCPTVMVGG